MNAKIKQFIDEATITELGVDNGFDRITFNKEKFAELIIKECIQLASPEDSYQDTWFAAKLSSALKIKHTFEII